VAAACHGRHAHRVTDVRQLLQGLLPLALLAACALADEPFDFDAACRAADAPATTPAELRHITETINGASGGGNYQPKGDDAVRWRAAVLLGDAAQRAAAPYAIPSVFQSHLPRQPDTTEVRGPQSELRAACK
jgi:hypothetical protein